MTQLRGGATGSRMAALKAKAKGEPQPEPPALPRQTGVMIPGSPMSAEQAQVALQLIADVPVSAKMWAQVGMLQLSLQRIADGSDVVSAAAVAPAAGSEAN